MLRMARDLLPVEEHVAEDYGQRAEEAADYDGEEDQAGLLDGERVDVLEDVGDGGEEGEERGELAGHVEAEEADDGLGGEHVQRADEGDGEELVEAGGASQSGGWRIRWGVDWVSLGFGEAALDGAVEGLAAEGEDEDEREGAEEEHGVLGPAPAAAGSDEGADHGAA